MLHQLPARVQEFVGRSLAQDRQTPFITIDLEEVERSYRNFAEAFPRVAPHYAVKANPNRSILATLRDLGAGFDVASPFEIDRLLDLGVETGRMLYAHPVKKPSAVELALSKGVTAMTADCAEEIEKVGQMARKVGVQASLLARIWVPNFGSVVDLSARFGAGTEEQERMFAAAGRASEETRLHGLSFHVGSQCINPANYTKAFRLAAERIAALRELGYTLDTLDIGGGFPVNYTLEVSYVEDVFEELERSMSRVPEGLELIAEPGRTFCATSATLVTQIIGRTRKGGKTWYVVDDSIYNTFSGKVYDFTDYRFFPLEREAVPGDEVVIAGCTCDGHDIISKASLLPTDLAVGSYLYAPNVGAYTSASASRFNGFEPAQRLVIE